ncbi:hypothetical protein DPMN_067855 [Dreissena polymorpha]|uniref:Uncharacterized protein n=1 Tax=Dreissena polymorpha TaxID=45954 RepID=A0A9D3YW10_DREPO|nr:hypothetical protein DPMN_067855 [Dreissena polymorpha]
MSHNNSSDLNSGIRIFEPVPRASTLDCNSTSQSAQVTGWSIEDSVISMPQSHSDEHSTSSRLIF